MGYHGKHEFSLVPLVGAVMRLSCSSLAKALGQDVSRGRLYCFVYIIGLGLDGLPLVYEVEWRNSTHVFVQYLSLCQGFMLCSLGLDVEPVWYNWLLKVTAYYFLITLTDFY